MTARSSCPDAIDVELAELVGYFMGDGSLHAKGMRLCVADTDLDVVERLRVLGKELFHLEPVVTAKEGYHEVALQSVRLARWWEAAGFAKTLPSDEHTGKGWMPRVPAACSRPTTRTCTRRSCGACSRPTAPCWTGCPASSTSSRVFAAEVRTLLLTLGLPTHDA